MSGERWAIVLMDGSPQPKPHHAWYVEGTEEEAERFREFVHAEIDPAFKIRLSNPLDEVLAWRKSVALPSMWSSAPPEIAALAAELCHSQPTEVAADMGARLARALDDWITL